MQTKHKFLAKLLTLLTALKMTTVIKKSIIFVALGLLAYFAIKIIFAIKKLQDVKIASVTTTHYEQTRLMPSISICFRRINATNKLEGPEHALNESRQALH